MYFPGFCMELVWHYCRRFLSSSPALMHRKAARQNRRSQSRSPAGDRVQRRAKRPKGQCSRAELRSHRRLRDGPEAAVMPPGLGNNPAAAPAALPTLPGRQRRQIDDGRADRFALVSQIGEASPFASTVAPGALGIAECVGFPRAAKRRLGGTSEGRRCYVKQQQVNGGVVVFVSHRWYSARDGA